MKHSIFRFCKFNALRFKANKKTPRVSETFFAYYTIQNGVFYGAFCFLICRWVWKAVFFCMRWANSRFFSEKWKKSGKRCNSRARPLYQ